MRSQLYVLSFLKVDSAKFPQQNFKRDLQNYVHSVDRGTHLMSAGRNGYNGPYVAPLTHMLPCEMCISEIYLKGLYRLFFIHEHVCVRFKGYVDCSSYMSMCMIHRKWLSSSTQKKRGAKTAP